MPQQVPIYTFIFEGIGLVLGFIYIHIYIYMDSILDLTKAQLVPIYIFI
jgi:hypothetical protein